MSTIKFRPRFSIESHLSADQAELVLREKYQSYRKLGFEGVQIKGHLTLMMPRKIRHYWSPQLSVSVSEVEDGPGSVIRCLLSPAPAVWTLFMFFYGVSGFLILVGLLLASSQYSLKYEMWGLWVAFAGAMLGVAMFAIAQVGKGISKEEMKVLRAFVEEVHW